MKTRLLSFVAILCLTLPAVPAMSQQPAPDLSGRARAALAQTSGRLAVPGLSRPVTVIRDPWGIPHIYAETQDDLFFAQGFVAAQDRLFQMELWRRAAEGRLAEILGPQHVERDRIARLLRYRGDLDAEYASYAPDAKAIIGSFVRGVNAYIETVRDRLPVELELAGFRPEPWTPEVCLSRVASLGVTGYAALEVVRALVIRELGTEAALDFYPPEPAAPLQVPEGLDLALADPKVLAGFFAAADSVKFEPRDHKEGSNNWVVDSSLSATGKPLLANDPHRALGVPSLRWMVHLVGPGWNVIGAGEPALPGVAAGHNDRVGFGFTIVGIDDGDTVRVTLGKDFKVTFGASFREILDVADWDRSMATSVPGQSGQPLSPHYADLLPLWAEGKYFPLLYSRERIEAESKERLVLEPVEKLP